jgi:hypothetical protein
MDDAAVAAAKEEARKHILAANEAFEKGSYAAALKEYEAAWELRHTMLTLPAMGLCLGHLERHDEALDVFEKALSWYISSISAQDKEEVWKEIAQLRKRTGKVDLTVTRDGGAPLVGATVVIDGRLRGEHPVPGALNVLPGEHVVRVYKEGFRRFERSVTVTQGQTVPIEARLELLKRSGRLRVEESTGMVLDVVVDGVIVGVTPLETALDVGEHTVVLRGKNEVGTLPFSVTVKLDETTKESRRAEQLGASIKVTPVPALASVVIDGFVVGRGVFEGRLRPGDHTIRVAADGYFTKTQKVSARAGEEVASIVTLTKDPNSSLWRKPGHFTLDLRGGLPLSRSFGGTLESGCTPGCTQGPALGGLVTLSGGYELPNGLGFGLTTGYLAMQQTTMSRPTQIQAVGLPGVSKGNATDTVSIQSFVAAAYGAYKLGDRFPVRLRLSAGVGIGRIADVRTGTFAPTDPTVELDYQVGPLTQSASSAWFFFSPEVRVGRRIVGKFELSLGLSALFLAGGIPRWNTTPVVNAGVDGAAEFLDDDEQVTSFLLYAITPDLSVRYDF